jgi:hypothetical protein
VNQYSDYEKRRPPILVMGPPRSGTSFCAMMLYTRFGVDMGDPKWIANEWEPEAWRTTKGHWERATTRVAAHCAARGQIHPYELVATLKELEHQYSAADTPWGAKHPDMTPLLSVLTDELPDAWYIYCTRDKHETAESMKRLYHLGHFHELEEHLLRVMKYNAHANAFLPKVPRKIIIDVKQWSDPGEEVLLGKLSEFLRLPVLDEPLTVPEPYYCYGTIGGLFKRDEDEERKREELDRLDSEVNC